MVASSPSEASLSRSQEVYRLSRGEGSTGHVTRLRSLGGNSSGGGEGCGSALPLWFSLQTRGATLLCGGAASVGMLHNGRNAAGRPSVFPSPASLSSVVLCSQWHWFFMCEYLPKLEPDWCDGIWWWEVYPVCLTEGSQLRWPVVTVPQELAGILRSCSAAVTWSPQMMCMTYWCCCLKRKVLFHWQGIEVLDEPVRGPFTGSFTVLTVVKIKMMEKSVKAISAWNVDFFSRSRRRVLRYTYPNMIIFKWKL